MVKSMTGFGRYESEIDGIAVSVELKAVNHKFLEINSRVPRAYSFLEENIKSFLKQNISRGKIDVFVNVDTGETAETNVAINHSYTKAYLEALNQLSIVYGIENDVKVSSLIKNPEVFNIEKEQIEDEKIWNAVLPVAEQAVKAFVSMREIEGEKLVEDIKSRIDLILKNVEYIEKRSPETVKIYRERLEQKMRELLGEFSADEQRILTETAIFADKIAVAEETVRLRSHMSQLVSLLDSGEVIGRRCDFIVQEMNREANTIGSKAQDVEIARCVVDIKAEIEKIREQIQNIE